MNKPVVLGEEAEQELAAAVDWYEERAGLGRELLLAVRGAARQIARRPASFQLVANIPAVLGVRRYLMQGFPYAVVFVELAEQVHVIAIAHLKRRPGYWRVRVRK